MLRTTDSRLPRTQCKAILGSGNVLETLMIEAGADLSAHRHARRIKAAVADLFQHAGVTACIACRRSLCTARPIAGVLIAFAPKPRAITTSPICLPCGDEPIAELSRHAERALGRVVPQGRWLDDLPEQHDSG